MLPLLMVSAGRLADECEAWHRRMSLATQGDRDRVGWSESYLDKDVVAELARLAAEPVAAGDTDIKIGLVCCWPTMRIYPLYSASLRGALESLTGRRVAVVTSDCACFEPEKALNHDYEYIDLRYIHRRSSPSRVKIAAKKVVYPVIEKRRGEAFASHTRDYDVVDFQQSSYAFGYESLKAFLEAGSSAKRIVTVHKVDPIQKEHPELNRVYNKADGVIVFSEFVRRGLMADGVDPGKIAVIHHGTALPDIRDMAKDQAILFCGSPIPQVKGFEQVVPALRMLREEGVELRVLVYGFFVDAEKDCAIGQARAAGVGDLLTWVSFTSEDELTAEYQRSIVCLVPYTGYAGYFPAAYAMGNGVPVVATDTMGHSEYLDGAGLLIAPGSAAELAAALKNVLDDERLRRELGAAGRRRAEESLSWRTVAEQTLRVFQAVLDGRPAADAARL
jgi:glycosyltransferase involved in cell wall biosynthesis